MSFRKYECFHTSDVLYEELKAKGFWMYRENFLWGRSDAWKNESGELLFVESGTVRTETEQFAHLMDCWRPADLEGSNLYCRMHDTGKLL